MAGQSLVQEVLGITNPAFRTRALTEAYGTLALPSGVEPSYMPTHEIPDPELRTDMNNVSHLLVRGRLIMGSTFDYWPLYQDLLQKHGHRLPSPSRALMVGSLTCLSSRAFDCLARRVYGATSTYIVDLRSGPYKRRHGMFMQASGLHLPFPSESMRLVHAHQLLAEVEAEATESGRSRPFDALGERQNALLGEMCRVLAPGGQLLLCEIPSGYEKGWDEGIKRAKTEALGASIVRMLRGWGPGMEGIALEFPQAYADYGFMFDSEQAFGNYAVGPNVSRIGVYARKSEDPAALAQARWRELTTEPQFRRSA